MNTKIALAAVLGVAIIVALAGLWAWRSRKQALEDLRKHIANCLDASVDIHHPMLWVGAWVLSAPCAAALEHGPDLLGQAMRSSSPDAVIRAVADARGRLVAYVPGPVLLGEEAARAWLKVASAQLAHSRGYTARPPFDHVLLIAHANTTKPRPDATLVELEEYLAVARGVAFIESPWLQPTSRSSLYLRRAAYIALIGAGVLAGVSAFSREQDAPPRTGERGFTPEPSPGETVAPIGAELAIKPLELPPLPSGAGGTGEHTASAKAQKRSPIPSPKASTQLAGTAKPATPAPTNTAKPPEAASTTKAPPAVSTSKAAVDAAKLPHEGTK
jgi:hypothetical protein